jgi:hypothetical protein
MAGGWGNAKRDRILDTRWRVSIVTYLYETWADLVQDGGCCHARPDNHYAAFRFSALADVVMGFGCAMGERNARSDVV